MAQSDTAESFWMRIALAASLFIVVGVCLWLLPLTEWLTAISNWVALRPVAGPLFFLLVFSVGTVLLWPGSLLCLFGGYLFGFVLGSALSTIGVMLGSTAAMLLGRKFCRAWLRERLHNHAQFSAIDLAVRNRGFLVVALTRMAMVLPYNFLNYAYGLTGVDWRAYVMGSGLGMLPVVMFYVYLGSVANNLEQVWEASLTTSAAGKLLLLAGLAAAIAVLWIIRRSASRLLAAEVLTEKSH